MAQTETVTAGAARVVRELARSNHRASSFHRREAARLMEVFDSMRDELASRGIQLIVEGEDGREHDRTGR